ALVAVARGREAVRAEGRGRRALVRAEGRRRRGAHVRELARAVQPPRQHRRRALARDPPGLDDALAAHARGAARRRRDPGPRTALGRPRERRRPHRRPRPGLRRRPRLTRLPAGPPAQRGSRTSQVHKSPLSLAAQRPDLAETCGFVGRMDPMDWQISEDTVPSAPVTEADARSMAGRPPATGAWQDGDPVGNRRFAWLGAFATERGDVLPHMRLAYETWGELAPDGSNAV